MSQTNNEKAPELLDSDSQAAEGIADDLPYRIVEAMGLGLTFRSCACGQLPCARLRPLRDALETVRRDAATLMRDKCVEKVQEFDGWVWCKCSECRADGRSHAVDAHASLFNLASEKENLRMDWQQVVLNGGPPCFHVDHESPNRYCGRAQRWDGHGPDHGFVSLDDLLATVRAEEREAALKEISARVEAVNPHLTYGSANGSMMKKCILAEIEAAATENRKGEG